METSNAKVINLDSRRWRRDKVNWDAYIVHGESIVHGVVKDFSPGGFFFHPEDGYVDGDFTDGENAFVKGDEVRLYVNVLMRTYRVEVRWHGKSQSNRAYGYGCEKLEMQVEAA